MRRFLFLVAVLLISAAADCSSEETSDETKDYPAAIMAEGSLYFLSDVPMSGEVDESAIIGYTTGYTDALPGKDGETNFNRELEMPYARAEDGIAVLYNNEWYLCTPKE